MSGRQMEPTGICYLIPEDAHTLLENARHALNLLADVNADAAFRDGVSAHGIAAVANYAARDLATVLACAKPVNVGAGGEP